MRLRDFLNSRPWIGWVAAVAFAGLAVWLFMKNTTGSETSQLTQTVTIRCRETGHEWTMTRGQMEKQLMLRAYPVNPEEGLINPETGKPTGFPVDNWTLTVRRINETRAPLAEKNAPKTPPPKH